MPVDRELWLQPLTSATRWLCPSCKKGHLQLVSESLKFEEPRNSRLARQDNDWDPDWISYRFVALIRCDNDDCLEPSVVHGEGGVRLDPEDHSRNTFCDCFYPRFVAPSPDLFEIAKKCPTNVSSTIRKAFVFSWGEYEACVNQIRKALELLLTARGVPRFTINSKGKRQILNLHSRIDKFASLTKDKHLSELMNAVRWLGNAGSHGSSKEVKGLEQTDAFDSLDLLQYVVDELYGKGSLRLAKLAKKINLRKGPMRSRKRGK